MTPAQRKNRAKARKAMSTSRAKTAYNLIVSSTGASRLAIEGRDTDASAKASDSIALRSIMKLMRRFVPLFLAAERELERRHIDAQYNHEVERVRSAIREGMKGSLIADIEDEVYRALLILKMKRRS